MKVQTPIFIDESIFDKNIAFHELAFLVAFLINYRDKRISVLVPEYLKGGQVSTFIIK